jgi:hypothetical protein
LGTVESLHGTTPVEIFESGLRNLDQIAAIALSVTWRDGTVTAGWSNADLAQLTLMLLTLDEKMRADHFRGGSPP